jgi:hypothetical protein
MICHSEMSKKHASGYPATRERVSAQVKSVVRLLDLGVDEAEAVQIVKDYGCERVHELLELSDSQLYAPEGEGESARASAECALRAYIKTQVDATRDKHPWPYQSVCDLLQKHGEVFRVESYAKQPYSLGKIGRCYANAIDAVLRRPTHLTYVEGYALSRLGVPLEHAWVVDDAGKAWDVTWKWSERSEHHRADESALIGVRVPINALQAHWRTCAGAAFLEDRRHHFPALRVPYSAWSDVLVDELAQIREKHCLPIVASGKAVEDEMSGMINTLVPGAVVCTRCNTQILKDEKRMWITDVTDGTQSRVCEPCGLTVAARYNVPLVE